MALPSALQQRLMKRGLLKPQPKKSDDAEEVFAESYDEPNESNKLKSSNTSGNSSTKKGEFGFDKIPNCPNRVNTFHECTDYCAKKYGFKKFQPHPVLERRRLRMLKIYPLLPNWVEVPDLETNRYYYWNTETNQVSWLSPSCPKAKFEYAKKKTEKPAETTKTYENAAASKPSQTMHESLDEFIEEVAPARPKHQHEGGGHRQQYAKKARSNDKLDPMDPSSYSDVPRGKWSAGLADKETTSNE